MKMDMLAEAIVATFDSHPEVEWYQLFSTEPVATFWAEDDIVLVRFQEAGESTWRVSFKVGSAKTPTQLVLNSVRILSGAFHAVREFIEHRQPERLLLDSEPLGTLFEVYLSQAGTKLRQMGYRAVSSMDETTVQRS